MNESLIMVGGSLVVLAALDKLGIARRVLVGVWDAKGGKFTLALFLTLIAIANNTSYQQAAAAVAVIIAFGFERRLQNDD